MKITEFSVNYTQTMQYRQFEPISISITARAEVNVGENPDKTLHDIFKKIQAKVEEEIVAKKKQRRDSLMESNDFELNEGGVYGRRAE